MSTAYCIPILYYDSRMNQTTSDPHMTIEEDEISLFDVLIVVADNLKLLVLGPVVAGLLALGYAFTLPQSFTSQAILALPAPAATQAPAMMVSPSVLDPVIESLNLAAGRPMQAVRTGLVGQVKVEVGKDGLLRLDVTANTPAQAQTIANAIIDSWLKTTVPDEQDRADLATRLAYAKISLTAVRQLLDRMAADGGASLKKPMTRGEAGTSIVAIGELQNRYLADVLSIPRTLKGLTRDVVKQPPTLSTEPVAPKKRQIAVLAALGSGFSLLLWVFMRQAWRTVMQDPTASEKQARLLASIGIKGRPH